MPLFGLTRDDVYKMSVKGNVSGLTKALTYKKDVNVRFAAASALGNAAKASDVRAVDALVERFKDENVYVRGAAVDALGKIGGEHAVMRMNGIIKDADANMRIWAVTVLGAIGDSKVGETLALALKDQDKGVRYAAAVSLGRRGDARGAGELVDVCLKNKPYPACKMAVEILEKIKDEQAADALIDVLKAPDYGVRNLAIDALMRIGGETTVNKLVGALKDSDSTVRGAAARALGGIGSAQAIEGLATALGDQSAGVRASVAMALGKLGDVRAVDELFVCLKDQFINVRLDAADALIKIGGAEVLEKLVAAVKSQDAYLRLGAAFTLGKMGDARAVDELAAALKDDPNTSNTARKILENIKDPRAMELVAAPQIIKDLQSLREKISDLSAKYEPSFDLGRDGRLKIGSTPTLVPAICTRIGDAARAFEKGLDANNMPVPRPQIAQTFKRLVEQTEEVDFYRAIGKELNAQGNYELRRSMDELKQIAGKIENCMNFPDGFQQHRVFVKPRVLDLRSSEEIAMESRARLPLEGKNEEIAQRLAELSKLSDTQYSTDKAAYDLTTAEFRRIGEQLCANGGDARMKLIAYRTQALGGRVRNCEHYWDGICGWMA